MAILGSGKKKIKEGFHRRTEAFLDNWSRPKTPYLDNINSIDAIYVVSVFVVAVLLSALLGGGTAAMTLCFLAAFVMISRPVKSMMVPKFYDQVAPWAKWLPYDDALKADRVARGLAEPDQEPARTPVPAGAVEDAKAEAEQGESKPAAGGVKEESIGLIDKAIGLWLDLQDEERREKAVKLSDFIRLHDESFDITAIQGAPDAVKPYVAEAIVKTYAAAKSPARVR